MSHRLLYRIKEDALYPPFHAKCTQLLDNCEKRGAIYVCTSGPRDYAEQDKLYAIGREPGNGKPGHHVTNARGGYSPHNFNVAIDCAYHLGSPTFDGKHLQADWSPANFAIYAEEARKLGLEWGGGWKTLKDLPHVQLPLKKHGISWDMMRAWYSKGGLPEVFKQLDARGPW